MRCPDRSMKFFHRGRVSSMTSFTASSMSTVEATALGSRSRSVKLLEPADRIRPVVDAFRCSGACAGISSSSSLRQDELIVPSIAIEQVV